MASLGHAVEVELNEEAEIAVRRKPNSESEMLTVSSFVISTSLASIVFSEAQDRSIPIA